MPIDLTTIEQELGKATGLGALLPAQMQQDLGSAGAIIAGAALGGAAIKTAVGSSSILSNVGGLSTLEKGAALGTVATSAKALLDNVAPSVFNPMPVTATNTTHKSTKKKSKRSKHANRRKKSSKKH